MIGNGGRLFNPKIAKHPKMIKLELLWFHISFRLCNRQSPIAIIFDSTHRFVDIGMYLAAIAECDEEIAQYKTQEWYWKLLMSLLFGFLFSQNFFPSWDDLSPIAFCNSNRF